MNKKIEQVIKERGYIVTRPKGTSMFPLIRNNKDDIYIERVDKPLKKYDIPIYIRSDGTYVMHRIVAVNDDGYVCCGDNQAVLEYGVKDSQIIGVLKAWYRGKKKHTVEDKGYLRYVKFWCKSLKRRRRLLWFSHRYLGFKMSVKGILSKFRKR